MTTSRIIPLCLGTDRLKVDFQPDNAFSLRLNLPRGLYLVSLHVDLSRFDWQRLWYPLTKYNNRGQLTGPWDFDLRCGNPPLVPTWKVYRDGRYVGLWYQARPTWEELEEKRLCSQFGFYLERDGEVAFDCRPYNEAVLDPIALVVEPEPFDRFEPPAWLSKGLAANWAHAVNRPDFWEQCRRNLADSGLAPLLANGREYFLAHCQNPKRPPLPAEALCLLAFCWRMQGDEAALAKAREVVRHYLDLPAWGNPQEDGYGHNGDMEAASTLEHLALAYNWLGDELGALRDELRARLIRQGNIFFELMLLQTQYWGGAIAQDHGFRSSARFASAAINLLGHAEEAKTWLAFLLPRLERTWAVLPADGFIPSSSYHKIDLYVNDMTALRHALLHAGGEDLFARPFYRKVPNFQLASLDEESSNTLVCTTRGDRKPFKGGLSFFAAMARDHDCAASAWLGRMLLEKYRADGWQVGNWESRYIRSAYTSLPFAIMAWTPRLWSAERPALPALNYFPDAGAIVYRPRPKRFVVNVMCESNVVAFHALGADLSSTDRGVLNPAFGRFVVSLGGEPLIQNAESGYRTGAHLSNVLLIDGKGPDGDMGYTMGVPMRDWPGARIQRCTADANGQSGYARLNLGIAYPAAMKVMTYTRDFFFTPSRLRVRDTVVCAQPHVFSWFFHTFERHRIEPQGPNAYAIHHENLALRLRAIGDGLTSRTGATEVVWAYSNENEDQNFNHIEVVHPEKIRELIVEFEVTA